jgi:small subunit ribosomal protein S13
LADKRPNKKKADDKGDDFKYIVRIVNTDIDGEKRAITALSSIKGIGDRIAGIAIKDIGFPPNKQIGHITDEEQANLVIILEELSETLPEWMLNRQKDWVSGDDIHLLSTELDMIQMDDINRMRMIRCYRGIRHENGHKVRGQRTRSNGRSGLTLGVSKRKVAN